MGIGNDVSHGSYNTSYGWLDNLAGVPNQPDYPTGSGNTFMGANSGTDNRGSDNTAVGFNAGGWFIKGSQNVFIGSGAAAYAYTSDYGDSGPGVTSRMLTGNSFLGYQAGYYNRADYNVFIGYQSGYANVTGIRNVFVGAGAGYASTLGDNSFLGYQAGQNTTTGTDNTFLGSVAGQSNTTGSLNTFVGSYNGQANTTGRLNAFVGFASGSSNTTGGVNTFVGAYAGTANTTGNQNTFSGYSAGQATTTGSNNVFTGYRAGNANTSGYSNVAMGIKAAYKNSTGNNNVAVGDSAGYNATVSANTFVGSKAGYNNQTGSQNTFVGYQSGQNVTTGSNNIIIGPNSGTAITTTDDNVLMGYNSQADEGIFNGIAIGANSRVAASNALILGNGVNVGIGTSRPTARLHVRSQQLNESGLRLEQLTSQSPAWLTTDQFLTVNENGEVVKARYQLRINKASEWSDKVFAPSYTLRSLNEVATYVQTHQHLPGVPSAEQVTREGVDLVKMNVTLLEKVEELTLYSIQLEQDLQSTKQKQQAEIDELKRLLNLVLDKK
ncbi:hypothetical protein GCM10028810_21910 [Spirosoma litoris]